MLLFCQCTRDLLRDLLVANFLVKDLTAEEFMAITTHVNTEVECVTSVRICSAYRFDK